VKATPRRSLLSTGSLLNELLKRDAAMIMELHHFYL